MASKQVVDQHPADGSVWVFNNPDAWGEIGAAHLTEGPSGLTVDWTDASFIVDQEYGDSAPDPENPDLAVAPDPSTGSLVLAYQSRVRQMFSTNPVVTGSHVAVARIGPDGPRLRHFSCCRPTPSASRPWGWWSGRARRDWPTDRSTRPRSPSTTSM